MSKTPSKNQEVKRGKAKHEQLVPLVGEGEATRLMCESCAKAANQ